MSNSTTHPLSMTYAICPTKTLGLRPNIPSFCPPLLRELIERCWAVDPKTRPSVEAVLTQLNVTLFHHPYNTFITLIVLIAFSLCDVCLIKHIYIYIFCLMSIISIRRSKVSL